MFELYLFIFRYIQLNSIIYLNLIESIVNSKYISILITWINVDRRSHHLLRVNCSYSTQVRWTHLAIHPFALFHFVFKMNIVLSDRGFHWSRRWCCFFIYWATFVCFRILYFNIAWCFVVEFTTKQQSFSGRICSLFGSGYCYLHTERSSELETKLMYLSFGFLLTFLNDCFLVNGLF